MSLWRHNLKQLPLEFNSNLTYVFLSLSNHRKLCHIGRYSKCRKFGNTSQQECVGAHWNNSSTLISWKRRWKMSIHLPLNLTFAPLQFFLVWKIMQMNALRYRKPPMFTKVALKDCHEMEPPLQWKHWTSW